VRVPRGDGVEPADAPRTARGRAVFVRALAERGGLVAAQLGRDGPSPTAVEYAFTTPMTRVILRGGIPAPTLAPPASGFELVTYG